MNVKLPRATFDPALHTSTDLTFTQASYVDDAVFHVEGQPNTILSRIAAAMAILYAAFASHGMKLNMDAGKTEFSMVAFGTGARKLRQEICHAGGVLFQVGPDQAFLRYTRVYKHMGGQCSPDLCLGPETAARTSAAHATIAKSRTRYFMNPVLPAKCRHQVARDYNDVALMHGV